MYLKYPYTKTQMFEGANKMFLFLFASYADMVESEIDENH